MSHILSKHTPPSTRRNSIGDAIFAPHVTAFTVTSVLSSQAALSSSAETDESSEGSCPSDDDDGERVSSTSEDESDADTVTTDDSEVRPSIRLVGQMSLEGLEQGDRTNYFSSECTTAKPQGDVRRPSRLPFMMIPPRRSSQAKEKSSKQRAGSGGGGGGGGGSNSSEATQDSNSGLAIDFYGDNKRSEGREEQRRRSDTITATRSRPADMVIAAPSPASFATRIEIEQVYDSDEESNSSARDALQTPMSPRTARKAARTEMMQVLGRNEGQDTPRASEGGNQARPALSVATSALPHTPGTTFHACYLGCPTPTSPQQLDVAGGVHLVLTPPTPRQQRSPVMGVVLQGSPRAAMRSGSGAFGNECTSCWLEAPIFELAPGRRRMEQAAAAQRQQQQQQQMQALAWLAWQQQMQEENMREMKAAGFATDSIGRGATYSPAGCSGGLPSILLPPSNLPVHQQLSLYEQRRQQRQQQHRARSASYGSGCAGVAADATASPRSASSWWRGAPTEYASADSNITGNSDNSVYSVDSGMYTGGLVDDDESSEDSCGSSVSSEQSKSSKSTNRQPAAKGPSAADAAGWWRRGAGSHSRSPPPPATPASAPPALATHRGELYVAPPRRVHFGNDTRRVAAAAGNSVLNGGGGADCCLKGRKEGEAPRTPSAAPTSVSAPVHGSRSRAAQSMLARLSGSRRFSSSATKTVSSC